MARQAGAGQHTAPAKGKANPQAAKAAPAPKAAKAKPPKKAAPPPEPPKAKYQKPRPAQDKLDAAGLDAICSHFKEGMGYGEISRKYGVGQARLFDWLAAVPERSARARAARSEAAASYEEQAARGIEEARDPFELAKAKELAYHLRWRASKVNPREYGEKLDVTQTTTVRDVSDEALASKLEKFGMADIAAKLKGSAR